MDSKLSRWCDGLIEIGWIVAVIGTPLFFNIHSSRVFEPDKLTLLRSIALLMIVAWIVKFIDQQGWKEMSWLSWRSDNSIWRLPFTVLVGALSLIYIISALFSVTPAASWLGSYQRLQGTYTTLSYIVVFALMVSTIRTRTQARRVVTFAIVTSIPISLYGMLQHFALDPLPWGGNTQTRIAGHMGNAIFVAAYLIMIVPLTVVRILDAFTNILEDEELSVADIIRSSIYLFALAIQLIAIYWTQSRGPWLGLLFGLFALMLIVLVNLRNASPQKGGFRLMEGVKALGLVFGISIAGFILLNFTINAITSGGRLSTLDGPMGSFAAFVGAMAVVILAMFVLMGARRGWRWLWLSWISVALLLGGWILAFNLSGNLSERFGGNPVIDTLVEWRELPVVGRFGTMLESDEGSGKVRVLIWQETLELVKPHAPLSFPDGGEDRFNFLRPIIGYGPESMYVAYNGFYPPELATVEARNASPDRSHNETIDALVITGISGFLVWQLIYLSVFFYGFRWLGVMSNRRDQYALIAFWVGGALVGGIGITAWLGAPFIGVAIPFGSMIGLILYLIYYALFSRTDDSDSPVNPFNADRLLVIGLVSAVLAHYVEIHFGIAIASTRTHFFAYLALIFLVGYLLPQLKESDITVPESVEETPPPPTTSRRRRRRRQAPRSQGLPEWVAPVAGSALILGLIVGILGYNFTTYSLSPGETISTIEDVPSASAIMQQTFFVNAQDGFEESPFLYLVVIMAWGLGGLLLLSEMIKDGVLVPVKATIDLPEQTSRIVAGIFGLWVIVGLVLRFTALSGVASSMETLGRSLLLIWVLLSAWAAFSLLRKSPKSSRIAALVAASGIAMVLPLLVAGEASAGLGLLISCAAALYLMWGETTSRLTQPVIALTVTSFAMGMTYAYLHASQLQSTFLLPAGVTENTADTVRRVLEADQSASVLTFFYSFLIIVILAAATVMTWPRMSKVRAVGEGSAYTALIILFIVALFGISRTNLRIIQADIVYKRADPWERQASRQRDPALWDQAIAIYEHAVELAPAEDFYYLFLGRAYLEQASVIANDPLAQEELLEEAESRLLLAQDLNPLNTDHTANLARLNTRWADSRSGEEREARIQRAKEYYDEAIELSPHNAVIRNEEARLAYAFGRDCEESIALYQRSAEIDPFYPETEFEIAEIQIACASNTEGEDQVEYYQAAAGNIEDGLDKVAAGVRGISQEQPRRWYQLAQVLEQLNDLDQALNAYENAEEQADSQVPAWTSQYQIARLYSLQGNEDAALETANVALQAAPDEQKPTIQQFIAGLTGEPVPPAEQPDAPQDDLNIPPIEPLSEDADRILIDAARPAAELAPDARMNLYDSSPPVVIDPEKDYEAVISTNLGDIRLRLYTQQAPLTVNNFVFLATQGFYDGVVFHRVIEDFMAQTGDPLGSGFGGPGYQFADETSNGLTFDEPGLLAMANSGANTNGSQFFITFVPTPWLNGAHTIFGEVVEGMDVVNSITIRDPQAGVPEPDVMERVDIYEIQ